MTWELVTLLSVVFICITTAVCFDRYSEVEIIEPQEIDLTPLKDEIAKIKADHESVHKLVEETKKLLSQQNLAQGLRGR